MQRVWDASIEGSHLELKLVDPDGEEHYPGQVNVVVTYKLTDENELVIDYSADCNKDTIINLTNHSYFNLAGHVSLISLIAANRLFKALIKNHFFTFSLQLMCMIIQSWSMLTVTLQRMNIASLQVSETLNPCLNNQWNSSRMSLMWSP